MSVDVLAALEAATVGSREMDAAIAQALGRRVEWHLDRDGGGWQAPQIPIQLTAQGGETVPAYTTSLDAALTLVPDADNCGLALEFGYEDRPPLAQTFRHEASAVTMPLAVCLLALRSQAGRDE